ncbi:MAG: trypsin-like serine protease [Pseudomonadota bacterium]|nr:trypsin-like serine protease [Pseudomonadota bacterium]
MTNWSPDHPAVNETSASRKPLQVVPFLALLFVLLTVPLPALARQGEPPLSSTSQDLTSVASVPVTALPAVEVTTLLAKDAKRTTPGPLTFAVPVPVQISPTSHGQWEDLPDGGKVWRLRFESPGATDLNFGFTRFRLPPGAKLYIISEAEGYFEGPYTAEDNEPHFQLWTPVVPGGKAVVELFLPAGVSPQTVELELTQVATGYLDLFGRSELSLIKQGSCNIDVICPQGEPWRNEIRSTAAIAFGGFLFCTGTLLADEPGTFRNFVLTADHCGIGPLNALSVVVYWNFESPVCGQLDGGSLADNQIGASYRAGRSDVDITLIELSTTPSPSFNVYYSGWDRSNNPLSPPLGSVGIHHPSGDEKAISFNLDPLVTVNNCIGTGGDSTDTHWEMDWEQGTTEPGSSGSGIWSPDSQGLVGFLSGGSASCFFPNGTDCYGKFAVAWDGLTPDIRLKDWLDPNGLDPVTVHGSDAPGALTLASPEPGVAGQVNDFTSTFATPGATVYYVYGTRTGSTAIPGCSGVVDIRNAKVFGNAMADPTGTAQLSRTVPSGAQGLNLLLQAVEPGSCSVSNRLSFVFQ